MLCFVGALVMEDIPYAAVVDDANLFKTCSGCFMKGGKLLSCSACKLLHYCSKVGDKPFLRDLIHSAAECSRLVNYIGLPT